LPPFLLLQGRGKAKNQEHFRNGAVRSQKYGTQY
jgi:hypothetical protein